ncbi:MAG: hypothetical protein JRF63_13330, partial [Deltaproteobacteria bacterium]|nr:hypothetical protein [Deltaproteobacteria bacterium]
MRLPAVLERPWARRAGRIWLVNFFGALAALVFLKLGLVGNNMISPETRGYDSFWNLVGKFFLFVGSDVFGAAIFALLVTLICAPLVLKSLERGALAVSALLQAAHALVASVSFTCVVYIGGPLNKTILDLAFASEHQGADGASAGVAESIADYV